MDDVNPPEITPLIQDPDDPDAYLVRFKVPNVPMPPGCLFQLAPDERLLLRLFDDGSVEYGPGVVPFTAAEQFWGYVRTIATHEQRRAGSCGSGNAGRGQHGRFPKRRRLNGWRQC